MTGQKQRNRNGHGRKIDFIVKIIKITTLCLNGYKHYNSIAETLINKILLCAELSWSQ